jgi:GNAT superfamily N-acetyltransferase
VNSKQAPITAADLEDMEAILALQRLAYQSEAAIVNDTQIPPLTQNLNEIRADFARQTYLKATLDDQIIGSVRGYVEGNTCYVGRLIVDPEYQNQGLGTRLLRAIEGVFGHAERFEIFTGSKSERNLYLYKREGYRECRRQQLSTAVELVFMEKVHPRRVGESRDSEGSGKPGKPLKIYQSQSKQRSDRE